MEVSRTSFLINVLWRFFERIGAQLVSFIVTIVIARLISPESFGTVALISVFTSILQVFVDSGLGNALIQKKDADDLDFSTVFYTNVVFCLIIYIFMFFISPLISSFYGDYNLTLYIRVVSITLIISGVKNVQQAYVSKHLLFRKFFFSTIIGTIVAAFVGIIMALKGLGVWALITQQLVNAFLDTVIVWITVKWRPKLCFSFSRLRELYSFGWKMLVTSLINTTFCKFRELVIGKFYSGTELAFYNRGNTLSLLVVQNVDASLSSVLMPTISNIQNNKERIQQIVKRTIKISTYIMSPFLLGLAAVSNNFVLIFLTESWLPCVPYLIIFCVGNLFYPLYTANLNSIAAMGRSDLYLKIEIVKKALGLVILLGACKFGVRAIAFSFLIERFLEVFVDVIPSGMLIKYGVYEQIKDVLPNYLISSFMFVVVHFVGKMGILPGLLLIIQIIVGMVIYVLLSIIFQNDSFMYIINLIKKSRSGENG